MTMLEYVILFGFALVILGVVLAAIRLVRGPSLADRIVALDLMTVQLVSFGGLTALLSGSAGLSGRGRRAGAGGLSGDRVPGALSGTSHPAPGGGTDMIHDLIVALFVLSGGIFCFAAGMGCAAPTC